MSRSVRRPAGALLGIAAVLMVSCSESPQTSPPPDFERLAAETKEKVDGYRLDDPRLQLRSNDVNEVRQSIEQADAAFARSDFETAFHAYTQIDYELRNLTTDAAKSVWSRGFGVEGADRPAAIKNTGYGFILAGRVDTDTNGTDAYLLHLSDTGSEKFRATYGGTGNDFALNVTQTADNGYLLVGQSSSFNDFSGDLYLVKTDSQGAEEWANAYGKSGTDVGIAAVERTHGDYLAFGRTFQGGEGMNLLLIHTRPDGAFLDQQSVGGPGDQFINQIVPLENERYLGVGTTGTLNNNDGKPLVMIVDASGTVHLQKEIDAPGFINPESVYIHPTQDGGCALVAGYLTEDKQLPAWSGKDRSESIVLFKLDAEFSSEWSRSYGGDLWDSPRAILPAPHGDGYVIVAATESFGHGGEDILLVQTDAVGERIWARTIGTDVDEFPVAAADAHRGFIIAAAQKEPGRSTESLDTLVIKTDNLGRSWRDGALWGTDGLTPREDPAIESGPPDTLVAEGAPMPGDKAPEINAAEWLNTDSPPNLESLRGHVVVVEFWATWCGPCRATIPHLRKLHNEYHDQGVTLISLTDENRAEAKIDAFVRDNDMPYIIGTGSTSIHEYGVIGIPTAFVIGRDGIIQWRGHPQSGLEEAIEQALHTDE